MKNRKIIACLDIREGRTVKGIKFKDLCDAGDPVELARNYVSQGVDELVFLDISATKEKRRPQIDWIKRVAREVNIPFTVGGGIRNLEEARLVFEAGADKISINSAAVANPELITALADEFGKKRIVLAIDAKRMKNEWKVVCNGGDFPTNLSAVAWAKKGETLGAGRILLTSMDNDGMKNGFAIKLTRSVSEAVNIPVIASGGAGRMKDFKTVFKQTKAIAALGAGVFHFGAINISTLKTYLKQQDS